MRSRQVNTKAGIHRAFEEIIQREGPATCNRIVERVNSTYKVTRVKIDTSRAAQYLIRNPNIIVVDETPEGYIYGLNDGGV